MNTAGAVGGVVSSLVFGFLVERTGSFDAVLLSMAGMLILGAALWIRTDATETLVTSCGVAVLGPYRGAGP
jgi:hypothetical protein